MISDYKELEKIIGYKFKSSKLIIQALSHRSIRKDYNNERLEFLGDAVLNLIVGDFLYHEFPLLAEGKLSKMRASLVNEDSLVNLSKEIELNKFVLISESEERNKGRYKKSIISDCFEAIIGAIYIESDMKFLEKFTIDLIKQTYKDLDLTKISKDFKTTLQEITQATLSVIPEYNLILEQGPEHKKIFTISITINGKKYGQGEGENKKKAEQNAAKNAIKQINEEAKREDVK
jgi:ribonuclease-3